MAKIREIVDIKGGYASYVDLRAEFFDDDANRDRMTRYMPIKAHREAFQRIARALYPKDRRCYLLTGSYGTGKSHLCLMIANYFAHQSDVPEMETFFENYANAQQELDPEEREKETPAATLKVNRSQGRYLVAVCEFGTKQDFEDVVLRAVDEALKAGELPDVLDSHYAEALRTLEGWEQEAKEGTAPVDFHDIFATQLQGRHPEWTVRKLRKSLSEHDRNAYDIFRQVYRIIMQRGFDYSKDHLVAILKDVLASDVFKQNYRGLVILYDEFGYALEENLVSIKTFHDFSQLCALGSKGCQPVMFLGTGHKPFTAYAKTWTTADFSTLGARIDEIPLRAEGMEDIIAAIVVPRKNHPEWKASITPRVGVFNRFASECNRLKLFDWLPAPKIRQRIIENIYPMHPVATYALIRMANEVGSDTRSVFKFFSPEFESDEDTWTNVQEESYPWFVQENEILDGEQLCLYTADRLFRYFEGSLTTDNKELRDAARGHIADYEATLKQLNRYVAQQSEQVLFNAVDDLTKRILRLMLICEIISVNSSFDNVAFGLNCTTQAERAPLEARLDNLCKAAVLYLNKTTQVYELRRSIRVDIDRLIYEYTSDPKNYPRDVVGKLEELVPLKKSDRFLEAKDYNTAYNEDKRLLRRFCLPTELEGEYEHEGAKESFFEHLEREWEEVTDFRTSYEGVAVYVLCENREAVERARELAVRNPFDRIVVAVPKEPIPVVDTMFTLMALKHLRDPEKNPDARDFTTQDNANLRQQEEDVTGQLTGARNAYFDSERVVWYGKHGSAILVDPRKEYDVANKTIDALYGSVRNTFAHDDFNKIHAIKFDRSKNRPLIEAVEKLLDLNAQVVVDFEYAQNRGEIRYLRNCLVNQQVLKQVDRSGSKHSFVMEQSAGKFRSSMPALAAMIDEVGSPEEKIPVRVLVDKYQEEYGQGMIGLSVMFACLRRRFGDSLRIRRDETAIGDMPLQTFEQLYDLLSGSYPNAYLHYKEIVPEERTFIDGVCRLFGGENVVASSGHQVVEAYTLLAEWWSKIPVVSRISDLYGKNTTPRKVIEVFRGINAKDAHSFVLGDLQTIYGHEPDELITEAKGKEILEGLDADKAAIEECLGEVKKAILDGARGIFGAQGQTDLDLVQGIQAWFNGLDTYQRDAQSPYHTNESKPLVTYLASITDLASTLFETLPSAPGYSLGKVQDWGSDKIEEYTTKIRKGKEHVDQNAMKVEEASVEFVGEHTVTKDGAVHYQGDLKVNLSHRDSSNVTIYVTNDGSDPTNAASERKEVVATRCELPITGHQTIKFTIKDGEGNYSRVRTLKLIDETRKYEIVLPQQESLVEPTVSFVFPTKNPRGFRVTLESLLRRIIETKIMNTDALKKEVDEVLQKILPR